MQLDMIHDIQKAYRKVLDSMSRPGLINNINGQAEKVDIQSKCSKASVVMALMLLDNEVTFKVASRYELETTTLFNQLTYANAVETGKADFIFIMKDAEEEETRIALKSAGIGDLLNPHSSATIIMEAEVLNNTPALSITGPGIEDMTCVKIGLPDDWIDIREEKNYEYPLGVDMIFIDPKGNILCLPRTTKINRCKEQVVS